MLSPASQHAQHNQQVPYVSSGIHNQDERLIHFEIKESLTSPISSPSM